MDRKKIKKIVRVICGILIIAGFILMFGVIGTDDVATAKGIYTDVGELIKKLSVCMIMVLSGTAGLNIL